MSDGEFHMSFHFMSSGSQQVMSFQVNMMLRVYSFQKENVSSFQEKTKKESVSHIMENIGSNYYL